LKALSNNKEKGLKGESPIPNQEVQQLIENLKGYLSLNSENPVFKKVVDQIDRDARRFGRASVVDNVLVRIANIARGVDPANMLKSTVDIKPTQSWSTSTHRAPRATVYRYVPELSAAMGGSFNQLCRSRAEADYFKKTLGGTIQSQEETVGPKRDRWSVL
jgi:hypothetical protein